MRLKQFVMCIPFLLSGHALADVREHCPVPSDIKEYPAGTYKAPTVSGGGEWYGVSQSGQGPVGKFELAIFKQHDVEEDLIGEILRCGYKLQSGGSLDLRFKNQGTLVRLDKSSPWEKWYSQYHCYDQGDRACSFEELVIPAKH
ncbi:hypothetical protein PS726_03209 [Pseudomonas fluorescens]|uniref:DUF3757 domain-containing protein n=1 Tax=Pseudomonas fluorescens TaxID=294 RepID=UPI000FC06C05|nr:DUF3757 domain-containing protein [Pseudomonas fluorescens]VVO08142.1 hypothetical protein PS726_03209 [Pseudomonas fluorescens]